MKWLFLLLFLSGFTWAEPEEFTVVFGQSRPPYIDEINHDGISLRLFSAVVSELGWKYKVLFASNQRMQFLLEQGKVNIAVEVQPTNTSLYYSQPFIAYTNYAFYHTDVAFSLNEMDDLKNFSVCAWQGAAQDLGIDKWASNTKNYNEYSIQKWQVLDWLNKRCEVMLIDESVLKWHLKQLNARWSKSNPTIEKNNFNKVLLPTNQNPLWFYVGFRDIKYRDAFNKQLTRLKQIGEYDKIRRDF
ncbi:substrate-binding periplasmic protein [Pseudoalteromonas sp.]|uniref:substrate-binding periplasmic protein n=1 Tax=Pseudoalteromonas sp. TaxID=53249 RepID=UPI003563F59F